MGGHKKMGVSRVSAPSVQLCTALTTCHSESTTNHAQVVFVGPPMFNRLYESALHHNITKQGQCVTRVVAQESIDTKCCSVTIVCCLKIAI